jgi:hypothetical protein
VLARTRRAFALDDAEHGIYVQLDATFCPLVALLGRPAQAPENN